MGDKKYAVEKIVRPTEQALDIKYVVRRYVYSAESDKLEPPKHISRQFISSYREWEKNEEKN